MPLPVHHPWWEDVFAFVFFGSIVGFVAYVIYGAMGDPWAAVREEQKQAPRLTGSFGPRRRKRPPVRRGRW